MRIQVLPPLVPDEPENGSASIGMGSNLDFSSKNETFEENANENIMKNNLKTRCNNSKEFYPNGYLPQKMHLYMHVLVVVALVYRIY